LKNIAHINETLGALVVPGRLPPVDIFPFLKLLPERFLGNWVTECIEAQQASDALYGSLIQMVMDRRKRLGPGNAYADRLIDNKEYKFTLHELMYLTGGVLDAGTDTTASVVVTLIQMLCAFPDVAKKAQQQIDAVVGEDRTPVWDDFPKLPIINQLMKETQRIRPVTPISFPHQMLEDTWVDGKLLPKGATIITNLTTIHNDSRKFQQPDIFNPEHYVDKPKLSQGYANTANPEDRDHYTYGFGRRICSGMYIAERSLFTSFSKLLWAFDITTQTDDAGKPIPVDTDPMTGYTDGIIVLPKPFKASIKVRSEKRRQTILNEFDAAAPIFAQFEMPLGHETA
jgi:cytochrome P450 family 619